MNKTVTVNISGIFFHIDEEAYHKLSKYLHSLSIHFQSNPGKDEIISDIESRIAEILQTKVNDKKQVVQMEDIDEIIGILGKPEDFSNEESETSTNSDNNNPNYETTREKRLYRDPDSRILGGVASGIAHYFNIDPVWIRLAFVITFFMSFGPLLYIIAWIIIPMARTTAEKLEMRGERVNISNIESSIKEEFEYIKRKAHKIKDEAKTYYKDKNFEYSKTRTYNKDKYYRDKYENSTHRGLDFFENIFKYGIRAIMIFAGIVILTIGIAFAIAFVAAFSIGANIGTSHMGLNISIPTFFNLFLSSSNLISMGIIGILLLIGIPIIMMIYGGIKLVFGIQHRIKIVSLSAAGLWFIGFIITLFVVLSGFQDFQDKGFKTQTYNLNDSLCKRLILKTSPAKYEEEINFDSNTNDTDVDSDIRIHSRNNNINIRHANHFKFDKFNIIKEENHYIYYALPQINFKKSNDNKYECFVIKSARGRTSLLANENADKIDYNIDIKDSTMILNRYFNLKSNKWRKQNVSITIKIPVGKEIYIDKSLENLNYQTNSDSDFAQVEKYNAWYTMTENGLKLSSRQ